MCVWGGGIHWQDQFDTDPLNCYCHICFLCFPIWAEYAIENMIHCLYDLKQNAKWRTGPSTVSVHRELRESFFCLPWTCWSITGSNTLVVFEPVLILWVEVERWWNCLHHVLLTDTMSLTHQKIIGDPVTDYMMRLLMGPGSPGLENIS